MSTNDLMFGCYLKLVFVSLLCTLRLTTDVQDFKSAFKMTVSQGLKASTQVRRFTKEHKIIYH